MFSIIGAILQFFLALFKEKQRGEIEDAGAAKAEVETLKHIDEMVDKAEKAVDSVDTSDDAIKNDPNNRLR